MGDRCLAEVIFLEIVFKNNFSTSLDVIFSWEGYRLEMRCLLMRRCSEDGWLFLSPKERSRFVEAFWTAVYWSAPHIVFT